MATGELVKAPGAMQSDVGELVAQGDAIIRIENETLMKVAIQRPRVEETVLAGALKELDMVPELAATAYYSIPYKDNQSGQTTMIEGPSIHAAMTLARRWGNCSAGGRMLSEDATGINVEGVFIDYESSFRVLRPQRISRFIKRRNGQVFELSPDRLLMATQAGVSKALRNAILAGLPAYLVSSYYKKAKQMVAGGDLSAMAGAAEVDKAIKSFARWEIRPEQIEAMLELPRAQWTREELAKLRGLWTALKDGQTTVEEAFGPRPGPDGDKPGGGGGEAKPEATKLDQLANSLAAAPTKAHEAVTPNASAGRVVEARPEPAESGSASTSPGLFPPEPAKAEKATGPGIAGVDHPDERQSIVLLIDAEKAKLERQPTADVWEKICEDVCGTTALDMADPAALQDLLGLVKGLLAKDREAIARVKRIMGTVAA